MESRQTRGTRGVVSRRSFLQGATLAAAGSLVGRPAFAWEDAAQPSVADLVAGKDPRLKLLVPAPLQVETPLELLREHRVTPKSLLFVRNNQDLQEASHLEPMPLSGWKIEVVGLVEFPRTLDAADLADMEQVEHELVLQCSGNGRSLFNRAAQVGGAQWGRGAMGNVRFAGVPLAAVFDRLGVNVHPRARFVTAEGRDVPASAESADFEHSIPLEEALEKSLLATHLNGEPLPALHGGPVRLVTPGFYATMNVKWLSRLRLEASETSNHHQVPRYRTPLTPLKPGTPMTFTLDNSEPNWHMRIKSTIFEPNDGATLSAGATMITGVAWNDGRAKIDSVEISLDEGRTWRRAECEAPAGPYAWHFWRFRVELPRGTHRIWSRAVDALGRAQPLDGAVHWNPDGYTYNGVDEVKVTVG